MAIFCGIMFFSDLLSTGVYFAVFLVVVWCGSAAGGVFACSGDVAVQVILNSKSKLR
jgi:hypothetical protein